MFTDGNTNQTRRNNCTAVRVMLVEYELLNLKHVVVDVAAILVLNNLIKR